MAMQDSNAIWLASFSLSLTFRNYQTQVSKQIRLSLWINGKLAYLGCALRVSLLCPFIFAAFSLAPPPGVGGPSLSSLFTAFPGFRAPLGFLRFFFDWMANTAIQREYYYDRYRVSQQKVELHCYILHRNFNKQNTITKGSYPLMQIQEIILLSFGLDLEYVNKWNRYLH